MYQALYRKYRPKDFDSVVGQTAIIKTLQNSIIHHNFSHAYMFFGPRGTGKTTVSKILARNINCLDPNNGLACGKCDSCKISFSKECIDIIEIDAASNNGVDEIRELKNKINLVPSELHYKVYIVDEVHMLSIGAFNALLKTLEEPPEHAVFILATTDPQKVPDTIISRCQCFSFQKLSSKVIFEQLNSICKKEKIKIDDDVLKSISVICDGGMRDALGLLDKLISYTDQKITMNDYIEVNGLISNEELNQFLLSVLNGDISSVLKYMDEFDTHGKNIVQIFIQLISFSRDLLVDYYLHNISFDYSCDLLQEFANLLNEKMFDIKKSNNTRVYIEMFLLKFIHDFVHTDRAIDSSLTNKNPALTSSVSNDIHLSIEENKNVDKNEIAVEKDVEEKIEVKNEEEQEEGSAAAAADDDDDDEFDFSKEYVDDEEIDSDVSSVDSLLPPKVLNMDEIMSARINNTFALANKELLKKEQSCFDLLKDFTFDQEIGYIACSLLDSKLRVVSENNILISYENDANVKQNLINLDKITEVYHKITNSHKNIAIVTDDEWNRLKDEYIANLKNGVCYKVIEEPKVVLEEIKKNDIIVNGAVDLFGDIVEIE